MPVNNPQGFGSTEINHEIRTVNYSVPKDLIDTKLIVFIAIEKVTRSEEEEQQTIPISCTFGSTSMIPMKSAIVNDTIFPLSNTIIGYWLDNPNSSVENESIVVQWPAFVRSTNIGIVTLDNIKDGPATDESVVGVNTADINITPAEIIPPSIMLFAIASANGTQTTYTPVEAPDQIAFDDINHTTQSGMRWSWRSETLSGVYPQGFRHISGTTPRRNAGLLTTFTVGGFGRSETLRVPARYHRLA